MATPTPGSKVIAYEPSVDLGEKGSTLANGRTSVYTVEELAGSQSIGSKDQIVTDNSRILKLNGNSESESFSILNDEGSTVVKFKGNRDIDTKGNILMEQGKYISNTAENFGISFGLTSPVQSDTIIAVGDMYDLASPPVTGITSSLLIGGSQLGSQDVYFVNTDHSNNIDSYLSLGTEGAKLRRSTSADTYTYVQVDENDDVVLYNRNDEGSGKKIFIQSENHDGAQSSHEIGVTAEYIVIRAKGGANTLHLYMQNLGTYADNTAALAGGLAVDELYKTAGGDIKIVV